MPIKSILDWLYRMCGYSVPDQSPFADTMVNPLLPEAVEIIVGIAENGTNGQVTYSNEVNNYVLVATAALERGREIAAEEHRATCTCATMNPDDVAAYELWGDGYMPIRRVHA